VRFAEPWAFLALILVPLVFLGFVVGERWKKKLLARAGSVDLLEQMALAGRSGTVRLVQACMLAVALIFGVAALARPQFGMRTETRKARGMDLVIALDLSRSMLARDVVPSRLERAKIEIRGLIEKLKGDRVGLVGFTSVALPLSPLTVDHSAVLLQLESATPDDLPRGGTSVGAAITAARRALETSKIKESAKAVVVITDGESHQDEAKDVAAEAKKAGIEVHVIGVGSRTGEPIPIYGKNGALEGYVKDKGGQTVVSRLEEEQLEAVAKAGGGLLALPGASGGLDVGPVERHLARLKKAELQDRVVRVYEERYQWALVPAFVLLLLATVLRPTRPRIRLVVKGLVAIAIQLGVVDAKASPFEADDPDVARGNKALQEGRAADAVGAYGEAEKRLGTDPRLAYDKGLAEAARGELDAAIPELQRALEGSSDPNLRARAAFALGNAQRKLKKYDQAIDAYKRALLEDPRLDGARRNLEIARSMKRIQDLQPKDPNQKNDENEPPPKNDQDAGPQDASEPPDAGDQGDGGSSGDSGSDGGSGDSGASQSGADAGTAEDSGSAGQQQEQKPKEEELGQQNAEQLLDALEEQEKALERKKLLEKIPRGAVEKDW
jgi:Ca-activated chloride channel homolog